jgi:hypothetical protein
MTLCAHSYVLWDEQDAWHVWRKRTCLSKCSKTSRHHKVWVGASLHGYILSHFIWLLDPLIRPCVNAAVDLTFSNYQLRNQSKWCRCLIRECKDCLWGQDFAHRSRPALGPTQPPVKWLLDFFPGGKTARAWRWPSTLSNTEVKGRVDLYFYYPSRPSWPVLVWKTLRACLLKWGLRI